MEQKIGRATGASVITAISSASDKAHFNALPYSFDEKCTVEAKPSSSHRGMVSLLRKLFVVPIAAAFAVASFSSKGVSQVSSTTLKQADAAYHAGQAALSRRDLVGAQADFEQVVRLDPQAEQGHSALGAVLVNRGLTKAGIRELEKALAIQPNDSTAQMNLALAFDQIGSPAKALPLFASVEARTHEQRRELPSYVLVAYARSLAQTGQLDLAIAKMKGAVALDSQNAELHDALGSLYAQRKEWPDAQREFATAIRLSPLLASAHLHLGLAMRAQGQANGVAEMIRASQLAPQNAMVALELGNTLAADGHDDQAIMAFRHVLDLEPGTVEAMYQLALALQRSNKIQDAITLFRKVLAAKPNNTAVMANLGMALCQAQQAKDAVPVLQQAVALDPRNVAALENLAAAYVQLNQFDDAIRELQAAIKLAPNQSQLHYDLGLAFKWQDNATAAIPELETAERLNGNAPEAPYLLGILYLQEGHYADAAREMNLALKLRPKDSDGWATLGSVYENLNKLPEAAAALQEAIRQNPAQPDAYLTLASVLVKQNQPEQAKLERHKAAELMRAHMDLQRAEVSTHTGNALLHSGDVAGASLQFQDALSYDPNYADAHLGLAEALDRQGKTIEAAAERKKAAQRDASRKP
jgi:tetratricopeptide (TPR) repeat protein